MITVKDIYDKTHDGLDVLLLFYPQARETLDKRNTPFKIRQSDDTPSAFIKEIKGVWRLTDFGQSDIALSPIDVCMKENNMKFNEAIHWLAKEFNVSGDVITVEKNRAKFDRQTASEKAKEGDFVWKDKPFTEYELKILGPKVTAEHCELLHWKNLEYYEKTNRAKEGDGLVTTRISSTETYPIFMRECIYMDKDEIKSFFKIYQPLNPDKAYRFFYSGNKPKKFINGLEELRQMYVAFNDGEQKKSTEESYKEKKLPEAFICSGERDSLCIKSNNYIPLWFNSETYNLSEPEYKEITKYVEKVYNIPDIDETGIIRGKKLALQYIDIYTIWLPKKLKEYRDNRCKPRKDFRDFSEIWPEKQALKNLIEVAQPVKFWEYKKNDKGRFNLEINSDYVANFLSCNGFATIEDKNGKTGKMFIRLQENIVHKVEVKDIRAFFRKFVRETYQNIDVRNLINNSTRLNPESLNDLDEIHLDFTDYTPESQYFFFPDTTYQVTAKDIIEVGKLQTRYVWADEVIPHKITKIDPAFKITQDPDGDFDIDILHIQSNYFKFLINSSRIYWRKEFEDQFLPGIHSDEARKYRETNHYNISGPGLTDDEVQEQKLHLINKMFTIGYLLHRHKSEHRAWCVFAMDNKIGGSDESNGGSGKSAALKTLRFFMNTETLSGRNPRLTENAHLYENVTEYTDLILVDDADKYMPFGFFYDSVTGEITVNPKFAKQYCIPFHQSAKYAITSNFTPDRADPSTERRLLYIVFSDYYHQKTANNDYYESRTIFDDFGKDLFREKYTEEEWNADINFMMECCRFYLSAIAKGIKIDPPMSNVTARTLRFEMTDIFFDWAQVYFSEGSENCDTLRPKADVLKAFADDTKQMKWTTNKFTKALRAYCRYADYVISLNPKELCNNSGRIIRKVNEKTTEMIFVQTKQTINYAAIDESGDNKPF